MNLSHIERSAVVERHPVAHFASYWENLRGERATPFWSQFDAADCKKLLPYVLLLKPNAEGHLYYAVSGTRCDDIFGFIYQGKMFGEGLPPDAVADRKAEFSIAIERQAPLYSRNMLPVDGKEYIEVFRGVFPFLSNDNSFDAMMVIIAPVSETHLPKGAASLPPTNTSI